MTAQARKKVLLMILDGWGIGAGNRADVIGSVAPQRLGELMKTYPHAQLRTDGENVGLPDGQMGNSEVGHLNIGAGRVLYQDLVKINRAVADGSIAENPEVKALINHCQTTGAALHIMGLLSDGGVRRLNSHMYAFLRFRKTAGLTKVYVHGFMDGRDTDRRVAKALLKRCSAKWRSPNALANLLSIVGRFGRWTEISVGNVCVVRTTCWCMALVIRSLICQTPFACPIVRASPMSSWNPSIWSMSMAVPWGALSQTTPLFVNFRNDRAKELTYVLTQEALADFDMAPLPLYFCTMSLRPDLQGSARPLPQGKRREHHR